MATKKLSTALAELPIKSNPSTDDSLILSAVDGTAQRLPLSEVAPPTLQSGSQGTTQNYIYSNSKDNPHAVMSGTFKVFQNGGKCYIRHKFWGSTNDYDDDEWTTQQIPYVNTSSDGVMQSSMLVRLRDSVLKETNSTATAVNVTYPNYAEGGVKTLTLSAATSAKAGVMTADDKVKLDALYANALELGNYPSEEDALNALADLSICANAKIVHAHLTYGDGNMSITMVQSIANDYTRQIIYNKAKVFQRGIYFTDANRSAIKFKEDWGCLFGDRMEWDRGENKYVLSQFDLTFNKDYTDPIPTATTNNDGLMSKEDKSKLDSAFVGVAANMVSYGDDYGLAYSFTRANGTGVKSTILPVVGKISGEPGLMKASDKNKFDELVNTTIPNLKQSAESVTALASQITALEAKVAALEKYGHLGSISWSKLTKLTTESTSEEIIANLQIKDCTGNLITDGDTIYSIFNACASYGKFLTDRQRYCKVQVELLSNTWVLTEIANGWYQEADGSWKHHRPTLKTISFDFNTNKQMSVHDVSASYPLYGQASE